MVCPLLSWLESEVRLQFCPEAKMVILHKQTVPEDVWVVHPQSVPSIHQTLGSRGRCHVSISTSMGGEVVDGILGSNKYMENFVSCLDFDLYI